MANKQVKIARNDNAKPTHLTTINKSPQLVPGEKESQNSKASVQSSSHQQLKNDQNSKRLTPTGGAKRDTFFGKLMGTVFHPDMSEVPDSKLQELRDQIHEVHEAERIRKHMRQRRRQIRQLKLNQLQTKQPIVKHGNQPQLIHINDFDGVANKKVRNSKTVSRVSSKSSLGGGGVSDTNSWHTDDFDYNGPTHISAFSNDKEAEWQAKRKKISQLYTGIGVYSHSPGNFFDTPDSSRFYTLLNEETRNKYPISHKTRIKIERIKSRREKNNNPSFACVEWIKRKFFQTSFGNVFRVTPRYYKLTPEVPKLCRRCKHPLAETMEARWTSTGIIFAILFPIVGLLCCLSNREFVCVVCGEIYLYGDFPSRCRPADTRKDSKDEAVFNLVGRKKSFKRWMKNEQLSREEAKHNLPLQEEE